MYVSTHPCYIFETYIYEHACNFMAVATDVVYLDTMICLLISLHMYSSVLPVAG